MVAVEIGVDSASKESDVIRDVVLCVTKAVAVVDDGSGLLIKVGIAAVFDDDDDDAMTRVFPPVVDDDAGSGSKKAMRDCLEVGAGAAGSSG